MNTSNVNTFKSIYLAVNSTEVFRDLDKGIPWGIIFFASGIWLYFSMPFEGDLITTIILVLLISALGLITKDNLFARNTCIICLLILLGYGIALKRSHDVAAPILPKKPLKYDIQILIEEIKPLKNNRIRYIGKVERISKLKPYQSPKRIRVTTVDQGIRFKIGEGFCAKVILYAPSGPERPGGYDAGFTLWFKQIGGTGYTISQPLNCSSNQYSMANHAPISTLIAKVRHLISDKIDQYLLGTERAIAQTLILGNRGKIPESDYTALRRAGLGHLLAISGLHMAMFAGTIFYFARALLALFPKIALNQPIKKWAAVAALIGGLGYFLISGQSIPTQRAFIMLAIMLLAILVNRPALTMRNITLAAMVILILRPESLLSPGFQMSFAAVTALIAMYQYNLRKAPLQNWKNHPLTRPIYYLSGICISSMIAGLATAPFALYHFHEISYMGPVGNMLAIPIFSLMIMPLAVLTLLTIFLGLEGIFLSLLGFSIELLMASAHWTASFEPAMWHVGEITPIALLFLIIGGVIICFKERPPKIIILFLIGIGLWQLKPPMKPDIYINKSGELFAVRGDDGKLHSLPGRKANFALSNWLKADGNNQTVNGARKSGVVICDDNGCSAKVKQYTITRLDNISALGEECEKADILISRWPIKRSCKSPKIFLNMKQFSQNGAYAIYIDEKKFKINKSYEHRNNRIWSSNKKHQN